jgi:hypothetical protein
MLLTKVKVATAVVLGIGLAGAGIGWVVVPGSGPGVVVAEETNDQPPKAPEQARVNPPQSSLDSIHRTLELILEAKRSLGERLEQAEQALQDFRLRNPFPTFMSEQARGRLGAVSAKQTELQVENSMIKSRLSVLQDLRQPKSDGSQSEQSARVALVKLQLRGIDVEKIRKAASPDGKEISAAELLRIYMEALQSESEEIKLSLKSLNELSENQSKVLREMINYELQEERLRNNIAQNRQLLDVITRRLSEINLIKDRESK